MNLHEIELRKRLQKSRRAYDMHVEKILDKNGWAVLGTGVEALVAHKPHMPYVLKLFPTNSAYVHFVKFCEQHAQHPHLPRFSRYVRPIPGTRFSYVRMEKLQPVSANQLRTTYAPHMCVVDQIVQKYTSNIFWNKDLSVRNIVKDEGYQDLADCAAHAPEIWKTTIQDLMHIMQQHGLEQFDLHSENMMLRGSELVITDPFV